MIPLAGAGIVAAAIAVVVGLSGASAVTPPPTPSTTPIKHLVVIFDENESFDHYFGTYPNATNPAGEPRFEAAPGTPSVNGLNDALLTANPNSANPQRLDRSQAVTCSQNHAYGPEQQAFDQGLMDRFVEFTAGGGCTDKSIVMDYYDGNTVTGLWNLAQHFAMNDNSFSTQFGPSTVGAINLVSGQTHGITPTTGSGIENGTVIGDPDPSTATNDDCANGSGVMNPRNTTAHTGGNVGDLLNEHHVTWGWFQGGFRPTSTVAGKAACASTHVNVAGATITDYVPHHEPFAYYASTANPHHVAPSSPDKIGFDDGDVHHQYDLRDFDTALENGNLPQVSFLKAAAFENGHPGNSDPLDEQRFIGRTLDALERSPDWSSTAVVIAYDDSDGWYDHVMSPIVSPSAAPSDALNGAGKCGNVKDPAAYPDRCGYGPRQPLMVISPYAKQNFVDNTLTDQTSILRFIEDNWQLGRLGDQSLDAKAGSLGNMFDFDPNDKRAPKVFLDPESGLVVKTAPATAVSPDDKPLPLPHDGGSSQSGGGPGAGFPPPPGHHGAASKVEAVKLRLTCTTKGGGREVTISCVAHGAGTAKTTAVRFRIVRGSKVLATASTRLRHARASAVLRPKRSLKKGTYVLRVTITQRGGVTATHSSVRLG
jgi:phospholipase C